MCLNCDRWRVSFSSNDSSELLYRPSYLLINLLIDSGHLTSPLKSRPCGRIEIRIPAGYNITRKICRRANAGINVPQRSIWVSLPQDRHVAPRSGWIWRGEMDRKFFLRNLGMDINTPHHGRISCTILRNFQYLCEVQWQIQYIFNLVAFATDSKVMAIGLF